MLCPFKEFKLFVRLFSMPNNSMSDCCFNLSISNLCSSLFLSDSICLISCFSNHF